MSKKLKIGLFGFGVVGQGLYDIVRTKNLNIEIVKIAIKDAGKTRSLPRELFTTDKNELLNNPEINTIVELINDTEAAYDIVSTALSTGKNVVSASKKMLATYLQELIDCNTSMVPPYYMKVRFAVVSQLSVTWKSIMITSYCTLSAVFLTVHPIISYQKAITKIWITIAH
jgi:hypothetical protein